MLLRDWGLMLLMSSGTVAISFRFLAMKDVQRSMRFFIYKKSADMRMGTAVSGSRSGFSLLMNFISHSNMSMSH